MKETVDVFQDIHDMHKKYGVHEWIDKELTTEWDWNRLDKYLEFRLNFLQEELNETIAANKEGNSKEIVDGLIDLIVVAVGTLDAFRIDGRKAWKEVLRANLEKEVGIKETRPNALGLPDLVKPSSWVGPDHTDNTGIL